MNSLILGSGFGLYGYLPAISVHSKFIYLNKKYKSKFLRRNELTKFYNKIKWFNNLSNIINDVDYIVIAIRPIDQFKIVKSLINKKKFKHLFLEKPISNNPKNSMRLIKYLEARKVNYSFGFLFEYLQWYKYLKKKLLKNNRFKIIWHIKINKKNKSWKYKANQGGGILRYYGIHLIKLIYDLNLINIKSNLMNKNLWRSEFYDNKNNLLEIDLRMGIRDKFKLIYKNKILVNSKNPFQKIINQKKIDPRSFILTKYINQNLFKSPNKYNRNIKFIYFWDKIERNK